MTKEEIRDWLDSTGRDRFWLADQIGSTKATVDSWFSTRGFPEYAIKIIKRLQSDAGTTTDPDVALVTFTLAEFEEIDRARRLAGYLTRREFYRDAIIEKAREPEPAADAGQAPLSAPVRYGTSPALIPLSRVAEAEAATDAPAKASAESPAAQPSPSRLAAAAFLDEAAAAQTAPEAPSAPQVLRR